MQLSVEKLSKSFPGVKALQNVDLHLKGGEVLSVIGENGAGKSTLMKILAGVQPADSGQILIDDQPVYFHNTRESMAHGVQLIHQELNLCGNLNIEQNIFLGREPRWSRTGLIKRREINRRSQEFLARVGLDVSPKTIVEQLSIGKQQMVEIAKALSTDARVLIMDEPTSSLSVKESESLFELIENLRDQGVGIIYISHRLAEVKRLSDRVTVLRDGENAGELSGKEINHDNMVRMMVGRDVSRVYDRTAGDAGEKVLEVNGLSTAAWPKQKISLSVHKGEIVGIAGLVGAGRTEVLQAIFGVQQKRAGTIRINGKAANPESPIEAIQQGLALVPEDRKQHGLFTEMTVRNNIGLAGLRRYATLGLANLSRQKRDSLSMRERLKIKSSSDLQIAKFLSGGNQQKVVIGKWLAMNPTVLLMDEPTRGIDIGAKQEIYQLMEQFVDEGMGILVVSSEMEEVMGISDRILVMHEGKITGELSRDQFSEEAIMELATGG